jgi:CBS domain-containing protein
MQEGRSGCLLVLGDKEELVGIFTERDFLKSVVGKGGSLEGRLGDVMTRSPTTLTVNDTVAGALELMQKGGYRHLPVLDESGMVKGVLSVKRIAHWLVEHFPTAVYTLPPDSNRASAVREGA